MAEEEQEDKIKMAEASLNTYQDLIGFEQSLLEKVKPTRRKNIITKARDYVWDIGLLFRIIKLKVEFASAGFEPVHESDKIEQQYKDLYEDLDMELFVRSAAFEHEVIGEWYPFYSWNNGEIESITVLNPSLVEVESVLGKEFIFLKPSSTYRKLMNNGSNEVKKELRKIVPSHIYKKWDKGKKAKLSKDETNRYVNIKAFHENYAHSPLEPIFGDLEILKTLQEADYATAKKLKQLLLQIKVGNEKYQNGDAVDKDLIDKTMDAWNDASQSQSMEWFTQWFVDAEYVTPDLEIFSEEKYDAVIQRIIDWSGINVMVEEGGSYGQGYIKVKGLKQAVANTRETIKKALNDFNKLLAEKHNITYYGKKQLPKIRFNNNALKDDEEIRKITQFLYKYGLLSEKETMETFNYDFDRQMRKKEEGEDYKDSISIHFEPGQGLTEEDNGSSTETDMNNPRDNENPRK